MRKAAFTHLVLIMAVSSIDVRPAEAGAQGTLQVVDETPIILPPEPGVMEGTWYNSAVVQHGSRWILYVQGHDDCPWMFDSLYASISNSGPVGPWSQPARLTPCRREQAGIPWTGQLHVFGIGGVVSDFFPATLRFPAMDLLTINYARANDNNQNWFYYGAVDDGRLFKRWVKFLDTSLIGSQMSIADPVPVRLAAKTFGFIFTYQDRRESMQFQLGYGVHDMQQKRTWVETTSHGWLEVGAADDYRIPADAEFLPVHNEWRMDVNQLSPLFDAGNTLKGYALYPTRIIGFEGDFRQREFHIDKDTFRWGGFNSLYWEYLIPNQGAPGCDPWRIATFPTGVGVHWFYSVDYYCDGSEFGHRAVVYGRVQP